MRCNFVRSLGNECCSRIPAEIGELIGESGWFSMAILSFYRRCLWFGYCFCEGMMALMFLRPNKKIESVIRYIQAVVHTRKAGLEELRHQKRQRFSADPIRALCYRYGAQYGIPQTTRFGTSKKMTLDGKDSWSSRPLGNNKRERHCWKHQRR